MKRLFEMLLGLGIGILVTVVVITLVNIRSDQVDNNPIIAQMKKNSKISRHTLREIRSCVEPSGKCYQDGQKRTGKAVNSIGQVTILAAACASDKNLVYMNVTDRAAYIQNCIIQELRNKNGKH